MTFAGLVLNSRYRLLDRLATGGMGEVWKAEDELLARPVAVKLLRREHLADEHAQARFRAEARYAAALQHVGIAQVYDYGEQDTSVPGPGHESETHLAYLVMELVPGEPLSKILARIGTLTPETTLDLIAQAARALQIAHSAGIIHRDVKPGNLMVTADGTVKITDFGIARGLAVSTLTQTGMVMGTAHYVSPEQASGRPITGATDLYSLGVVAYECLAGHPPFDAEAPVAIALKHVREAPPELAPAIPAQVRDLVGSLLAKEPEDRPGSAQEVADRAFVLRDVLVMDLADPLRPDDTGHLTGLPRDLPTETYGPFTPAKLAVGGVADTLGSEVSGRPPEHSAGRRRSAVMFASVAAGVLLLVMIVVGSLWRGPASADLKQNRDQIPAVLPAPTTSGRSPVPSPSVTAPKPGSQMPAVTSTTASTIPTPSASPTGRPTTTRPTRKPTVPPKPTPSTTPSTPPVSTPPPDPSPSRGGGLGSE